MVIVNAEAMLSEQDEEKLRAKKKRKRKGNWPLKM